MVVQSDLHIHGTPALRLLCLCMAVLTLASCDLFEFAPSKSSVIGHWKAESLGIDSLKLPIAPNVQITEDALILITAEGQSMIPIESIDLAGPEVTLNFRGGNGAGLSFAFESRDRMYFTVPLLGTKIYYDRQRRN